MKSKKTKQGKTATKAIEEEETAIAQLEAIRLQFSTWEGGHVWDEHICLLCGHSGKRNAPKCALEIFQLALKSSAEKR